MTSSKQFRDSQLSREKHMIAGPFPVSSFSPLYFANVACSSMAHPWTHYTVFQDPRPLTCIIHTHLPLTYALGFFEPKLILLWKLYLLSIIEYSPCLCHPTHSQASQVYVIREVFLLLFRGSKNFTHISLHIHSMPRSPDSQACPAKGHGTHLNVRQSNSYHHPHRLSSRGSSSFSPSEKWLMHPLPWSLWRPRPQPLVCAFHECYGTRWNAPRGIPRRCMEAKSTLIRVLASDRAWGGLPYQPWELAPKAHTNPAAENRHW